MFVTGCGQTLFHSAFESPHRQQLLSTSGIGLDKVTKWVLQPLIPQKMGLTPLYAHYTYCVSLLVNMRQLTPRSRLREIDYMSITP